MIVGDFYKLEHNRLTRNVCSVRPALDTLLTTVQSVVCVCERKGEGEGGMQGRCENRK